MRLVKSACVLLLSSFFLCPLSADEAEPAIACEKAYDLCWEKCETAKTASEECFDSCEQKHEECITLPEEGQ